MDAFSRMEAFPYSILRHIMIKTKHDVLTMFLNMKPPIFIFLKTEKILSSLLLFYERMNTMGIVEQHGVEFLTFQL